MLHLFISYILCLQWQSTLSNAKIAVIGAGPAGSSFAYHLSKMVQNAPNVKIDLFEATAKVGGRVDSIYVPFEEGVVVDFGASIFVDSNPIMYNMSKLFNLTYTSSKGSFGFYDGKKSEFLFESSTYSWWTKVKMAYRYGWSLKKGTDAGDEAAARYKGIYELDSFDNMSKLVRSLNLEDTLNVTTREYLEGYNENYLNEIVDVTTIINYGRNIDQSHALGSLVGILSDNAYTIDGGNSLIFENMLNHSIADIYYNSRVTKVSKRNATYALTINETIFPDYDFVVLASGEFVLSDLELDFKISYIPDVQYYHIFVTMVIGTINPKYFNRDAVPDSIFCTRDSCEFQSISKIRSGSKGHLYKIFSRYSSIAFLAKVFSEISWSKEQSYFSYPKLHPGPEMLPIEVAHNVFYASSMETVLSTMETQCVSGLNIAKLVLKSLKTQ